MSEVPGVNMRVSTSLDSGAKEIAGDKPSIIFVQTHLSGFSADILLMHLKKQLGRRRSRFVLLCDPGQISDEILNLYHAYIDIAQEDSRLLSSVMELITALTHKAKNEADAVEQPQDSEESINRVQQADIFSATIGSETAVNQDTFVPMQQSIAAPIADPDNSIEGVEINVPTPLENAELNSPTLEEQGIVYSPRTAISVYSEFTNSFDNAVSSMPPNQPLSELDNWKHEQQDFIEVADTPKRPQIATFLIWAVPLLVVVIAFTFYQNKVSPKPRETSSPSLVPEKSTTITPTPVQQPATPTVQPDVAKTIPAAIPKPEPKLVIPRITKLPDFFPAEERDKKFSKSNPGWERYKGHNMDFKVYREDRTTITAIQVIDRSGKGVPESFLQNVLTRLAKSPVFVLESSEKKDGYEIQRGQIADNLKTVYYRDTEGGKLRGFVLTWQ